MKSACFGLGMIGILLTALAGIAADDSKEEAIKKDRKLIEGTWRVVAIEVNGNKASDENARKISVVNERDGVWSLFSDGKVVAKGTNVFDPTTKPKHIDFTITEGDGKGGTFLGIYDLGEKTRKLCFAPPGKDRPTDFESTSGNEHILVTFEREK